MEERERASRRGADSWQNLSPEEEGEISRAFVYLNGILAGKFWRENFGGIGVEGEGGLVFCFLPEGRGRETLARR